MEKEDELNSCRLGSVELILHNNASIATSKNFPCATEKTDNGDDSFK